MELCGDSGGSVRAVLAVLVSRYVVKTVTYHSSAWYRITAAGLCTAGCFCYSLRLLVPSTI